MVYILHYDLINHAYVTVAT